MEKKWILKGRQRNIEGESYSVAIFDNELECQKEMELLKQEFPGHFFWCEIYSTTMDDESWTELTGFWSEI